MKSCVFCGSKGIISRVPDSGSIRYYAHCTDCVNETKSYFDKLEALLEWQRENREPIKYTGQPFCKAVVCKECNTLVDSSR